MLFIVAIYFVVGDYLSFLTEQVRSAFSKTVVCLAHFAQKDGACPPPLVQGLYGKWRQGCNINFQNSHLIVRLIINNDKTNCHSFDAN